MSIFLNIVYVVIVISYLPFVVFKRKWQQGLAERLGRFSPEFYQRIDSKSKIWIHAVSVGEVLAVAELVKRLTSEYPNHKFICSTVTPTGYELARSALSSEIEVIFAPADFSWIVRRVVQRFRPDLYIAAETELWPNLYRALDEHGVPIILVNGRISDQSFSGYLRARIFFRNALEAVRIFAMQTSEDADRIIALGADPARVRIVGNLKFQPLESYHQVIPFDNLSKFQILLGGSTHPGEEEILFAAQRFLRRHVPELRLMIVPRHPERIDDLMKSIRGFDLKPVLLSQMGQEWELNSVIVVDKMGLLRSLYRIALVVFVGKSFVVGGGQNMIEPIAFGKPTFVGPMTQNFKDVVTILVREKVLFQVELSQHLGERMLAVLQDQNLCHDLQMRGPEVVTKYVGAMEKIVTLIKEILH